MRAPIAAIGCISLYSYIKPQPFAKISLAEIVVSLSIPTSNHNSLEVERKTRALYLSLFLHQTTTPDNTPTHSNRCISLYSYIKPQRFGDVEFFDFVVSLSIPTSNHNSPFCTIFPLSVVSLSIPTSNHNLDLLAFRHSEVVSLSIPTSNHNCRRSCSPPPSLYLSLFLHQTTTRRPCNGSLRQLYLSLFLHQTTTWNKIKTLQLMLYLSLFLHQTTTHHLHLCLRLCCISLYSYIKPQPPLLFTFTFLSCISLYSYIKPQPRRVRSSAINVVSLSIPTSNHNIHRFRFTDHVVVSLSIPTSNHNPFASVIILEELYLSLFLHQTTTTSAHISRKIKLYLSLFLHQTTTFYC